MPPISVMIKPASNLCNLSCRYCFYRDVSGSREKPFRGMMTATLLETVVRNAFEYADGKRVAISFQGGEPLLRGKDFFRVYVRLLSRLNERGSEVYSAVQTNATLIDDEWCDIFLSGNFLVGVSLDGDERADENRVDAAGNGSFSKTLAATDLLTRRGVPFNVLSVLTKDSATRIGEIYAFLKSRGFRNLQFIPCLRRLDGTEDGEFCPSPDEYAEFLIELFKLYLEDFKNGDYVSVRQMDNFVLLANGREAEQCGMNGHCTFQYVVEGDGETYPCDFYCIDKYSLGNVRERSFTDMSRDPVMLNFIRESFKDREECGRCTYGKLCGGGCKRERRDLDKCEAYKRFFGYALPYLRRMS